MLIEESLHWKRKKRHRKSIEPYMIEFVLMNSDYSKDKLHENALNALARIPQTGKTLKIVFSILGRNKIKLITAYYLD